MDDILKMPFGKYKGKPLSEIPHGYLLYLYDQNKLTGKIKRYAEENIPILRFKSSSDESKNNKRFDAE